MVMCDPSALTEGALFVAAFSRCDSGLPTSWECMTTMPGAHSIRDDDRQCLRRLEFLIPILFLIEAPRFQLKLNFSHFTKNRAKAASLNLFLKFRQSAAQFENRASPVGNDAIPVRLVRGIDRVRQQSQLKTKISDI